MRGMEVCYYIQYLFFLLFFAFNLHYLSLIIRFHFNDSRFERKKCKISRRLSVFDSLETNEKFRSNWWKNISIYEKSVRQIVRQDKSVILRERIARVWSFYLPVIGSGVHEIHLPAEECFSFSLSLSSLKVRACLVENKADRDVKPGDFRTPLFTVFLFRHYEWIPRWIFTSGPRGSKILRRLHPTPDSILCSPPFSPVEEESSLPDTCCCPSIRPRDRLTLPSLPIPPCLPPLLPSSLSSLFLTFLPFFIFFDFFPLTRQNGIFLPLSVFLLFFFFLLLFVSLVSCFAFKFFLRSFRSGEGDVFHRGCIALWSCFEVSGCLNWTQVSRFKEILGKNNIPNETSNIWYK